MQLTSLFFTIFLGCVSAYVETNVPDFKRLFDQSLYEDAIDEELCSQQLSYMTNNNTLLMYRFIDSSFRTPKGLLEGNFADYGNYEQCLKIYEESPFSAIEGKFCMIRTPLGQNLTLPSLPELPDWNITWPEIPGLVPDRPRYEEAMLMQLSHYRQLRGGLEYMPEDDVSRVAEGNPLSNARLFLALCVPKACTTQQAINEALFNLDVVGLEYEDAFCRLPNDKRWVTADYLFFAVFSLLLFLVTLSTGYDLYQTIVLKNDAKSLNRILLSFSVYTNTRRLVTYNAVPGTIECLDGVRSFAMMWVICGHTFVNQVALLVANPRDVISWITSAGAIWCTMGPITVDTFFMLSGLLLVYTTAGKMSRSKLIQNLHLFYLNRLLRMFPLLAAYVVIQASLLGWVDDGPNWTTVASHVENCRVNWWSTLLYVQNWVHPTNMCLYHSWYLAIDVQLYIISPLFLYWVLGGRKTSAWISLSAGLILSLVGSSVYNFIKEFQSGPIMPSRPIADQAYYLNYYYMNTLCRSSPFFVGMIYGYLLHLYKGQKLNIPKIHIATLWACAIALLGLVTGLHYPIMQVDWDNQIVDSIVNSYMRPAWALALGWIVFACATGYGGPINWVLSLRCFKVISRLSYGMYIVHYPLIFVFNSSSIAPVFFDVQRSLYLFLADFTLAAAVSYILTMLIDAPCSTLVKIFMGGPRKPPQPRVVENEKAGIDNGGIVNHGYETEDHKTNL